ncbi:MAG TPA: hypothetical protein VI895_12145 [Bdellovibrionota bacterium]|nr:hypothetical protein [Bdellovibrionota bacterium]
MNPFAKNRKATRGKRLPSAASIACSVGFLLTLSGAQAQEPCPNLTQDAIDDLTLQAADVISESTATSTDILNELALLESDNTHNSEFSESEYAEDALDAANNVIADYSEQDTDSDGDLSEAVSDEINDTFNDPTIVQCKSENYLTQTFANTSGTAVTAANNLIAALQNANSRIGSVDAATTTAINHAIASVQAHVGKLTTVTTAICCSRTLTKPANSVKQSGKSKSR